jgi:hypothetical protein
MRVRREREVALRDGLGASGGGAVDLDVAALGEVRREELALAPARAPRRALGTFDEQLVYELCGSPLEYVWSGL